VKGRLLESKKNVIIIMGECCANVPENKFKNARFWLLKHYVLQTVLKQWFIALEFRHAQHMAHGPNVAQRSF
jgi:hypothetical protein